MSSVKTENEEVTIEAETGNVNVNVNANDEWEPKSKPTRRGIAKRLAEENFLLTAVKKSNQIYTSKIDDFRNAMKEWKEVQEVFCPSLKTQPEVSSRLSSKEASADVAIDVTEDESFLDYIPTKRTARGISSQEEGSQKSNNIINNLKTQASLFKKVKETEFFDSSFPTNKNEFVEDVETLKENREFMLKVRWMSNIMKLPMKKGDVFALIYTKIADIVNVPTKFLLLSFDDVVIKPGDTPASLGVTVSDIIECGKLSEDAKDIDDFIDPTLMNFKLQSKDMKKKLILSIRKSDKLTLLIEKFAKERGISTGKISLNFDGETLDANKTPEEMDLESDYCIDVIIRS